MSALLKFWYLITILLSALSLGPALAHLLEMPAKLTFDGELWLELHHRLYPPAFGTVGAFFEVAAVLAAIVLVMLTRRHRFRVWTIAGAMLLLASHIAFWIWVAPVNAIMTPASSLPADWVSLRNQWEYAHAARALLQFAGLAAIVCSLLQASSCSFNTTRPTESPR